MFSHFLLAHISVLSTLKRDPVAEFCLQTTLLKTFADFNKQLEFNSNQS